MHRNVSLIVFAHVFFLLSFTETGAQSFPNRSVRFIVPAAAGGPTDMMARLFAHHLEPVWQVPIVVENKLGASGIIGTEQVVKAIPDGHVLGFIYQTHVTNPGLRKLPFNTVRDLSGVILYGVSPLVMTAAPSFPLRTLEEVIAYARAHPGELNYATPGNGTAAHMAGELLKLSVGVDMVQVPFNGSGKAYPEVLSGRVPLMFDPLFSSMSFIKTGRLKPIVVTSPKRALAAPNIPTIAEHVPGFEIQGIFGVVAPSLTPRSIIDRLNTDFLEVMGQATVQARFSELGIEPVGASSGEFDILIQSEIQKWTKVIREANIKID